MPNRKRMGLWPSDPDTQVRLVINLSTAKALGITITQPVLVRGRVGPIVDQTAIIIAASLSQTVNPRWRAPVRMTGARRRGRA
jgi:hypothetical protein